jgi:16S rRNA (uracil1498-N3)-methyltransferase
MTHRFCIASEQLDANQVRFTDEQAHQLRDVLRARPGARVQVFDGRDRVDRLVELTDAARGRVVGEVAQAPEPRTRLSVYPALLQRDKFELVLQKLTEVGAASITPLVTARSLVREAPDERRYARWHAILREAAEQCGRGVVPELRPARPLANALQCDFCEDLPGESLSVMACEGERQNALRAALRGRPKRVALFVGPEGGYTPEEMACARDAGARMVTLGPRVLRAETAALVASALVLYELGDLSWPADAAAAVESGDDE